MKETEFQSKNAILFKLSSTHRILNIIRIIILYVGSKRTLGSTRV